MPTTITRAADGALLTFPMAGGTVDVIDFPGLYDVVKERSFTSGALGEQTPLSSTIAPKIFEIHILFNDFNGILVREAMRFFATSDSFFRLVAPEYGVTTPLEFSYRTHQLEGWTKGGPRLVITCVSRYGDFVEEIREVLHSVSVGIGASFPSFSSLEINSNHVPCSVEVSLEAATAAAEWNSGTEITVATSSGLATVADIGIVEGNGSLSDFTGKRFVLDSFSEIRDGRGVIDPLESSQPWRVASPGSATVQVPTFLNPANEAITVTISFVAVTQALTI